MDDEEVGHGEGETGQHLLSWEPLVGCDVVADEEHRGPAVALREADDRSHRDGEDGAPPLDDDQIGSEGADAPGGPEPRTRAERVEDGLTVGRKPPTARIELG